MAALLLLTLFPVLPQAASPASAQEEEPVNLLRNPSFERSHDEPLQGPRPYYWSINPYPPPDNATICQDTVEFASGFHSAIVSSPGADQDDELSWYQRVDLEEGDALGMGGWVMADLEEGARAHLRVSFGRFDADPADTWELTLDDGSTGWTELSRDPQSVPSTERVYFQCVLSGPGTVWFDDVWLGEPSITGNPPIIVSVPPLDAAVGVEYSYRARAVDLEGDDIAFDLYRGPEGMTVSSGGDVNWTPTDLPEEAVKVVVRATDANGLAGYQDFFLRVSAEPVVRPVHVFLYSHHDDPFNGGLSMERYDVLLPILETLVEDHPGEGPTVSVLFSGADDQPWYDLSDLKAAGETIALGYTAFHEPNYDTNPLYDPVYATWDWDQRVQAIDSLLSRARDLGTGEPLATGMGGLSKYIRDNGHPWTVAGVGTDGAQLHSLDRYDDGALVLGIEDGPPGIGTMVGDPSEGTLVSMLSDDPSTPLGVYWQGGRLQMALDEVGTGPVYARQGVGPLEEVLAGLDRRRVNVLPVLVMDRGTYCNGSATASGEQVRSPTDWGYSHPESPQLPAEGVIGWDERQASYAATCSTMEWLAGEMLPDTGGDFLSPADVRGSVDPGVGITVSAAELATAADDLLVRRNELRSPDWVGISWGYCRGDYQYFSLADMYGLLVQALAAYDGYGALPATVDLVNVHGPRDEAPPSQPGNRVFLASVVSEATRQVDAITDDVWRVDPRSTVPYTSTPGGVEVNAMEFLLLMAATYMVLFEGEVAGNPLLNLLPSYQWPVTRSVLQLEGRPIDTGDSWDLKPASANTKVDDQPPQVRYVTPSDGTVNVPLSENVTATFSERMDETADLAGMLTLDPPVEAELRWQYHRLLLDPLGNLTENTTYTATLGTGLTDAAGNHLPGEVSWSFTTTGVPNLPPVLFPLPEDPHVEVEENRTVRFSLYAEDEGPYPLTIEWWLDGVRVSGENGDQFVHRPTHTDAGNHTVTVVVSDSAAPPGQTTFTWNLTVLNVNTPPVLVDTTPAEGDVEAPESEEGEVRFSVSAEDPDEGELNYQWMVNDTPVNVSLVSGDGSSYTFPLDYESAGEYAVVCWVADRVNEGFWVRWELTVTDVNRPPVVLGIEPSLAPTVEAGKTVPVEVNATDPDGDVLTYVWSVDGAVAAETEAPVWTFTSLRDGSFSITVTVEDGRGGNATAGTTVNVLPEVEPQPQREPSSAIWVLVVVVAAAIVLALAWPRLRGRTQG
jgi:hypothetical protein